VLRGPARSVAEVVPAGRRRAGRGAGAQPRGAVASWDAAGTSPCSCAVRLAPQVAEAVPGRHSMERPSQVDAVNDDR
jgi:hypothetical protein